jgi:Ala-tRNA(Pro) deacylase
MSIPRNIREHLEANHIEWRRRIHPVSFTAEQTARAAHVPCSEFAKTVILKADGQLIMAMVPANCRVRGDALRAELLCNRLVLATERDFAFKFVGCARGAMPPFGSLFGVRVLCDKALAREFEIEFNGGVHTETIRMRFSEFEMLERPTILEMSEKDRVLPVGRAA